jgi:hypothetical protein
MTFDLTSFSYGCGVVMMPYIVGMAVGMVWRVINVLGNG